MKNRKLKCIVGVLLAGILCMAIVSCSKKKEEASAPKPKLKLESKYMKLEKSEFAPGENINVTFTTPESAQENGWFGIIPSRIEHGSEQVNHDHELVFHLLKNSKPTDTFTFPAPEMAGEYDIRMNDNDSSGKEIDSISFRVVMPAGQPDSNQPLIPPKQLESKYMKLEKVQFSPGEYVKVAFTIPPTAQKNGWAGIVPSRVEHGSEKINDEHDMVFHLRMQQEKNTDTYTFTAPQMAGAYDIRMNDDDSDGKEIDSISFIVVLPGGEAPK